jgi:PKHD-type hydroxylase
MNLQYYYWYYKKGISKELCTKILNEGLKKRKKIALTGSYNNKDIKNKKILNEIKKKRDCKVVWLDEKWVYKLIHDFINDANKASGWNFDVNFTEKAQFTIYNKSNYYDWHIDEMDPVNNPKNKEMHGKIRKLSMSILLNNPNEYEGGELEFNTPNGVFKCTELEQEGSLVVFPSNVLHRVTPVTKGTRYSLVSWTLGPPYK